MNIDDMFFPMDDTVMRKQLEIERGDDIFYCYGAALLLASIYARVATMEARGERPPDWEDAKACVRGIIAAGVVDVYVPELEERLCAIAEDCGVSNPRDFFADDSAQSKIFAPG